MRHSKWLLLVVLAIAQFMVVLDVSVVNVALPAMKQALHFTTSGLQWIITAYTLTFGGLLLLGGRMADLFGRRRTLMAGMAGFTAASLLIGLSHSALLLIFLRALEGASAAFMSPGALSIVLATFPEGQERGNALSVWSAVAIAGQAVGLVLGGVITQYFGWRWDFFINIPVGLVVLAALPKIVPSFPRATTDSKSDIPGASLVTAGLLLLVYAFSQTPAWSWGSGRFLGMIAISVAMLLGFGLRESRTDTPLVPLAIFRNRNLLTTNIVIALLFVGVLGNLFLSSQYMQTVMRYTPARTGLAFVAIPVTFMVVASRVPRLMHAFGYKKLLVAGTTLVAISMLWLSHLPVHGSYAVNLLPPFVLIAAGMSINLVSLITAGTAGVAKHETGLASGLIATSQQTGGALGLAALSSIAAVNNKAIRLAAAMLTQGYDRAFMVAFGMAAAALPLIVGVVREPRSRKNDTRKPTNKRRRRSMQRLWNPYKSS